MIQPTTLRLKGKSQKQIIDGLTARNLEMHIDNCKMAEELKKLQLQVNFYKVRAKLLEDTCLQHEVTIPDLLGEG